MTLSPLAEEIIKDLNGPLFGNTTLHKLHVWLGDPKERLLAALDELVAFKRVTLMRGVYRLVIQ